MFNQKNKYQIITPQWHLFSVYALSRAAFDFMKGRMRPAGHMFDATGLYDKPRSKSSKSTGHDDW